MQIKAVDSSTRKSIVDLIAKNWGSPIMVTKGRVHDLSKLPGYIVYEGMEIKGLITYNVENDECEITSFDSFEENKGIGSALLEKVVKTAEEIGCKRIWLITTNDNTKAMRFYQKRGFDLKAIYCGSVQEARKIKPEIPLYGNDNIPIMHEIEFEKIMNNTYPFSLMPLLD